MWLPGATRPAHLPESMIGSYGFDPLNMGTDPAVLARFQVRSLPIPLTLPSHTLTGATAGRGGGDDGDGSAAAGQHRGFHGAGLGAAGRTWGAAALG